MASDCLLQSVFGDFVLSMPFHGQHSLEPVGSALAPQNNDKPPPHLFRICKVLDRDPAKHEVLHNIKAFNIQSPIIEDS